MTEKEKRSKRHSAGWFVRLFKAYSDTLRMLSESVGLHSGQPAILCLLNSEPDIPQNLIAKKLSIAEASVTTMIARMEKGGLISRRNDARKIRVKLTELGFRRFCEIEEKLASFDPLIFEGLSADEKKVFLRNIELVTENLDKALGKFAADKKGLPQEDAD